MPDSSSAQRKGRFTKPHDRSWTASLICSYIFDWVVLVIVAGAGGGLHLIEPNKRPFSLVDPNIAFPFTESETVPVWLLLVLNLFVPALIILLVCLIFVPGNTVPEGTPKSLIWKRKLWELHVGLLGLALAIVGAWFITNGMKNMFGKPRPDLLSRCEPDWSLSTDFIKISDEEEALGLQNYGRHSPSPSGSRATHRVFNGHAADHRDQGHEQADYFDPASETPSARRLDSRQDGQSMGHFDPYISAQAR
ncbi:predicted protein [Verticillium alfalfae VaMs.102]|uniref:Predicted protein n=1 Tax=Verticillium alfalfae (strain VaMs.102 / ATCC MYA-4576 / FGSC 10136) TaxID=526221 RepID=C9SJY4_VERA1|nr:predicted protein [Verticillium alfalfae VaMs.102]EEY19002.1 predicted protein [Verticillium alfalfae VaMs.102]